MTIAKTGRREEILTTQNVVRTAEDVRELYPLHDLAEASKAAAGTRRMQNRACCRSGPRPMTATPGRW